MAGERAFLVPFAPPFPLPTPPAKKLNWGGGVGRKREYRLSREQPFTFIIIWQLFTVKATEHEALFPLAPTMVGRGRQGHPGPCHGPAGEESCRPSPVLTAAHQEGERQIKAVPSSTAPQIKSEVPPSER